MNFSRLMPRAATAAALMMAIGCGGGGGSSEMTVSAQNAEQIAGAGVGAVSMAEGMSDMMDGMAEMFSGSAQVMPCDSGNAILDLNDIGPAGLSTGDNASIDFNACRIDVGEGNFLTINGGLFLEADDIVGDPLAGGAFTRAFTGGYSGLTMTIFGGVMTINGVITASASSADGVTFVLDVSCPSFSAFAQGGDATFSGKLTNYQSQRTWNETTGEYSVSFEGTIYASGLGTGHFETTVPFTGIGSDHPSAGTLVATGANGGTVTLIAVDNVNVQILVDADGDTVAETTINTTWDALES